MPREYTTHDGWKRACKTLLTRELAKRHKPPVIHHGLTGLTKEDFRDFCICAVPIDLNQTYAWLRDRGFTSIGEWQGDKGYVNEDAASRISDVIAIANSL